MNKKYMIKVEYCRVLVESSKSSRIDFGGVLGSAARCLSLGDPDNSLASEFLRELVFELVRGRVSNGISAEGEPVGI